MDFTDFILRKWREKDPYLLDYEGFQRFLKRALTPATHYGDWYVYYCATENYWFLRNERTLEEIPIRFDHPPSKLEIQFVVQEYRKGKKIFDQFVWNFLKPIVVFSADCRDIIPEWMKNRVQIERLMQSLKGDYGKATDIEALIYIYTATLNVVPSREWVRIYQFLLKKYRDADFLEEIKLTDYEMKLLDDLKEWIWKVQLSKFKVGEVKK